MKTIMTKTKVDFRRLSGSYVTHLLKGTRSHFDFTTDIVQGLGSFDLEILLKLPVALASMCFSKLYMAFQFHGCLVCEQESQVLDEYMSFVDEIRISYTEFDQPTLLITDTIDFLRRQTTLISRLLLLRCFKLACLCLDEPFRPSRAINFSSVNSGDPSSKLVDIVLPVESFFHKFPGSIECVTSVSSIAEF